MITPEQIVAAQKSQFETLLGLSYKAFEAGEKLVELNMQVAKANLAEASETALAALSVKDPQALVALQSGLVKPAGEKIAAYNREVYGITSAASAEFGKVAQAAMEDLQKSLLAAVEEASKNAPAGSENVVALMKSAMSGATGAYEGFQKSAKQMTEVAAANLSAMGETAVKASKPKRVA